MNKCEGVIYSMSYFFFFFFGFAKDNIVGRIKIRYNFKASVVF
jgi:hypothetical protein